MVPTVWAISISRLGRAAKALTCCWLRTVVPRKPALTVGNSCSLAKSTKALIGATSSPKANRVAVGPCRTEASTSLSAPLAARSIRLFLVTSRIASCLASSRRSVWS